MSRVRSIGRAILLALAAVSLMASQEPTDSTMLDAGVTVRWEDRRQSIDGFGASSDYFVRDFAAFPRSEQQRVLDALFSTTDGAGLSIVRGRIWDGSCDGPDTRCAIKPTPLTHNPAPGVWAFDCPADEVTERCRPGRARDHWQIWFADEAKKRAGDLVFMFSVWSPPGWMKETRRPENGGKLLRRHYPDYAEYLSRNLREYASRYDLQASVISVQNEPGLAGPAATTIWSPEDLRDFVRDHLGPRLAADNVEAKIMVAEDQYWGEQSAAATLADPAAARFIGVFGGHNYNMGATEFGGAARPIDLGAAAAVPLWMTEVSRHGQGVPFDPSIDDALGWAKSIHEFMTIPQASAWLYWRFQRPFGPDSEVWPAGGKEALINMVPETQRIELTKRLWAMGNFSRFVRPGFVRVDVRGTRVEGVHLSAYRNARNRTAPSNSAVLVAINTNDAPVALRDSSGMVPDRAFRTSASEDLASLSLVPRTQTSNGETGLLLAPRSITTFVGTLRR